MRLYLSLGLAITIAMATACTSSQPVDKPTVQLKAVTVDASKIITGQTVYVPIYSHIYTVDQTRRVDLTATLSVRNTDLANSIIITSVKYHDTNGQLVRTDLDTPVELQALSSIDFVVEKSDISGGVGANFIVEWVAENQVTEPVIEAVMIDTIGNQGISFVSPGRVLKSRSLSR